jgi:hypothetical protein
VVGLQEHFKTRKIAASGGKTVRHGKKLLFSSNMTDFSGLHASGTGSHLHHKEIVFLHEYTTNTC